jgi:hypothetical protein
MGNASTIFSSLLTCTSSCAYNGAVGIVLAGANGGPFTNSSPFPDRIRICALMRGPASPGRNEESQCNQLAPVPRTWLAWKRLTDA